MAEEEKPVDPQLYADWEDKEAAQSEQFENPLEMRKWEVEPDAKGKWEDVNKDSVFGNLGISEMLGINMGEDFMTSIEALRAMMPNDLIAFYFFPVSMTEASKRKKSSTLALSLSKDGFLRQILQTRFVQKGYDYRQTPVDKEESKPSPFFFLRKKKKKTSEMI